MPPIDIAFPGAAPSSRTREARIAKSSSRSMHLSTRECEILDLIYTGKTNAQVASELGISLPAFKKHLQRIFQKIQVRNRAEAAEKYAGVLQALRRDEARHRHPDTPVIVQAAAAPTNSRALWPWST